jgi:soluble lytic murein transglycosylase
LPQPFRRLFLLVFLALAAAPALAAEKLSSHDRKVYGQAFDAADKLQWVKAREIAAQAKNPLLAKVVLWLDLVQSGPGRSFADMQRFLADNPDWPLLGAMRANAERAMPHGLDSAEVAAWFGDREPATAAGVMRLATALFDLGLDEQAGRLVRRGWVENDMTAEEEQEFLALFRKELRAQDHDARLDRLLWDRQENAARRMLKRVDEAHQRLADARLRLMNMDPGVDGAVSRVPAALKDDPGLIYDRARWRRNKGMYEEVVELLDPPVTGARQPERMWREIEDAARRALSRGDISVAYRLAKHHESESGTAFADGEWLAGWIALRFLREPRPAYEHFTRLYAGVSTSISQSRGAYWAGRAAEAMGEMTLARNWYRTAAESTTTYYGQLAAQRLGTGEALRFPTLPQPTAEQTAQFDENELVRVVRLLGQIDQLDRARAFVVRLVDHAKTPADHRLIADLAAEQGRNDLMVAAAKEARRFGVELVEYLYPLRDLPKEIDPEAALVLGVIRQESAFAVTAVSSAGARGLMQLMPATAKHVAKKEGLKFEEKKLTRDPSYNIRLGSAYLQELIDRFRGSYILAIAGYNAGPSRSLEWIRQYGDPRDADVDVIDWIESIPFSETRNYVQRVIENLMVYRHRLGDTQLAQQEEPALGTTPTR